VIDIGCGYAIPAVWLLSLYPRAKVFGIDPDRKRVAVAIRVLGDRGTAEVGGAPDLPAKAPEKVDTVLMLDMMHLLDDDALRLTFQRIEERLEPSGRLILRATIPSRKRLSWLRRLEEWRLQTVRATPHYRPVEAINTLLTGVGLTVTHVEAAAADREEIWFVAEKQKAGKQT
jgi:cyclopropane fatty-acyl-phospholipid synthase-like methyltransferase